MPELSKAAVVVELAEVQIHQTALAPNLDSSGQLKTSYKCFPPTKSSEYFRSTRKKYVNPTPSASAIIRPLIHIVHLYSNKGLLVSPRCVKHSVHPCDCIHSKHDDLEHGKEDVERRLTVIPTHVVTSARARHLICEKERQLVLTQLTKGQKT